MSERTTALQENGIETELSSDQVASILQYESNGKCFRGISTANLLQKFREINEQSVMSKASDDKKHLNYLDERERNIFEIIGYKK